MSVGVKMAAMFAGSFQMADPHCTLIYLGTTMHPTKRPVLEQAVQRLRMQVTPLMVPTLGFSVFGNGTATVITLKPDILKSWRQFIEKELRRDGIYSASEWAYNPHVTINQHSVSSQPILPWDNFKMPATIWLGKPELWWNQD